MLSPLKNLAALAPEPNLAALSTPEFNSEASMLLLVRVCVPEVVTTSTAFAWIVPMPLEIKLRLISVSDPVAEMEGLAVVMALVRVT